MTHDPLSMQYEAEHAIDVAKQHSPSAVFWRGDVRSVLRHGVQVPSLSPGESFNLVDDSDFNHHRLAGQFRALTLTAAPEGYTAVVAVESTAVSSQIPTVRMSQVIKAKIAEKKA